MKCLTKPFLPHASACLVEDPRCRFATALGFSYLCEHPSHKSFQGGELPDLTLLNQRYEELRQSRREKFFQETGSPHEEGAER